MGKGKILIFVPNRYNQNYKKPFIILNICKENTTFNEANLLYDHDEFYGAMIVEQETELLTLSKSNISQVTDQDTLDILRDAFSGKDRLYKALLQKISLQNGEEILKQQQNFVQAFNLDFNKIEQSFIKHIKNGNIYTTEAITKQKENMEKFNKKVGKMQLSYKPQGEIDESDNKEQKMIFGTNRIVAREMQNAKGMTATQQLALKNLQNIGVSRRSGKINDSDPLKDLSQMEVQKYKNNMLNAVKEEENTKLFNDYKLVKKGLGEKQLQNSTPDGTALVENRKKKIQQCGLPGITKKVSEDEVRVIMFEKKLSINEEQNLEKKKQPVCTINKARQKLMCDI